MNKLYIASWYSREGEQDLDFFLFVSNSESEGERRGDFEECYNRERGYYPEIDDNGDFTIGKVDKYMDRKSRQYKIVAVPMDELG